MRGACIRILILSMHDLCVVDSRFQTLLHAAAKCCFQSMVMALFETNSVVDKNARDDHGYTPLDLIPVGDKWLVPSSRKRYTSETLYEYMRTERGCEHRRCRSGAASGRGAFHGTSEQLDERFGQIAFTEPAGRAKSRGRKASVPPRRAETTDDGNTHSSEEEVEV